MATDPVCGMTIEPRRAMAKAKHKGKTHYFCTPKCHQAFTANPEKYISEVEPRRKSKSASGAAEISVDERHRMIAERAYYRAQRRGFAPGAELEDWLLAEAEIDREPEGR